MRVVLKRLFLSVVLAAYSYVGFAALNPNNPSGPDLMEPDGCAGNFMVTFNPFDERYTFSPAGNGDWINGTMTGGVEYHWYTDNLLDQTDPGFKLYVCCPPICGPVAHADDIAWPSNLNADLRYTPITTSSFMLNIYDVGGGGGAYDLHMRGLPGNRSGSGNGSGSSGIGDNGGGSSSSGCFLR